MKMTPKNFPAPLVIVGPSGVGKGTILSKLLERYSSSFGYSVSHTTRKPRPGEVHGKDYFFIDGVESMRKEISQGVFIEHANVHTNMYGTSRQGLRDVQERGRICILEIDVQGADQVKDAKLEPCPRFVFIAPPSLEELEDRLRGRKTETEDKIQVRLENARGEMSYLDKKGYWDLVLVNNSVDEAVSSLEENLLSWYPHLKADNSQ